jgi:hypothetical protein
MRARPVGGARPDPSAGHETPRSLSSSRSHTSLSVGNAGTACHRVSIGTLPTIAMVAECSSSPTPGPTKVAPISSRRSASMTSCAVPLSAG